MSAMNILPDLLTFRLPSQNLKALDGENELGASADGEENAWQEPPEFSEMLSTAESGESRMSVEGWSPPDVLWRRPAPALREMLNETVATERVNPGAEAAEPVNQESDDVAAVKDIDVVYFFDQLLADDTDHRVVGLEIEATADERANAENDKEVPESRADRAAPAPAAEAVAQASPVTPAFQGVELSRVASNRPVHLSGAPMAPERPPVRVAEKASRPAKEVQAERDHAPSGIEPTAAGRRPDPDRPQAPSAPIDGVNRDALDDLKNIARLAIRAPVAMERTGANVAPDEETASGSVKLDVVRHETHFVPLVGTHPVRQIGEVVVTGAMAVAKTIHTNPAPVESPVVKVLELRLEPRDLGTVHIRMSLSNGAITLSLKVEGQDMAGRVHRERDVLSNMLQASGLTLDGLVVQAIDGDKAIVARDAPTSGHSAQDGQNAPSVSGNRTSADPGASGGRANDNTRPKGDGSATPHESKEPSQANIRSVPASPAGIYL